MTETVKITRTKAYKIQLSRGADIQVDQEEVEKVINGMTSGALIALKQGIVNPSYIVAVVEDGERVKMWMEDTKYDSDERKEGMQSIGNIFENSPIGKLLEERKQING